MADDNKEINTEIVKDKKGIKKYIPFVWEIVKIAIIAFVIVAPIRYFLFQPFIVSGASMDPNFATGDYLIIDEISYRFSEPQRGDVVVFNAGFIPNYSGQRFIKRVIGLPGETVGVTNGEVKIIKDGKTTVLDEKYLPRPGGYPLKTIGETAITLKADEYFVLGDNRQYSYDSRVWGVVLRKDIIGKAFLRIFPITTLSEITRPSY
jgi:signal peptidase I